MTDQGQYSLDALLQPEEEGREHTPARRSGIPAKAGSREVPGPAEGVSRDRANESEKNSSTPDASCDAATSNPVRDREPIAFPNRRMRRPRDLEHVNFRSGDLVPVVAQDAETGEILMLAYANRTCLALTLDTGQMYFWSRSRSDIRRKGTTSGKVLSLVGLYVDCDADTVLAMVRPEGPACNTGARTCFVEPGAQEPEPRRAAATAPSQRAFQGDEVLDNLRATLRLRARESPPDSGTARLLADENLRLRHLGAKLVELAIALTGSDAAMVTEAAADLVQHLLVTLEGAPVSLQSVAAELAHRVADDQH